MNWVMAGGIAITIPLLIFYRENYNRLNVDVITDSPDGVGESADDRKQSNEDEDEDEDGYRQLSVNRDLRSEEEEDNDDDSQSLAASINGQVNVRC